jgi:hypothetical protein
MGFPALMGLAERNPDLEHEFVLRYRPDPGTPRLVEGRKGTKCPECL